MGYEVGGVTYDSYDAAMEAARSELEALYGPEYLDKLETY